MSVYCRILAVVFLVASSAGAEADVVMPVRSGDGRDAYHLRITLRAPRDEGLTINGGTVLAWTQTGRVFSSRRFNAAEFASWAGRKVSLLAGQMMLFSRQERFWPADDPARLAYVFQATTASGQRIRLVKQFALGAPMEGLQATVEEPLGTPRFEVRAAPDRLVGLRLPRTRKLCWIFSVWAQETGGVPITLTGLEWAAHTAGGELLYRERLGAEDIRQITGGADVCGPDGFLEIGGRRLILDEGSAPPELMLVVKGTTPAGESLTALGRVTMLPPQERPARTGLALPFRGDWRVLRGPGEGRHSGDLMFTWVFEAVDKQGRAYVGDGSRLRDHRSYDQPVLAPASGRVVAIVDFRSDPQRPVGNGLFGGGSGENYVVIDHGNKEYSYLGGLRRDSVRVNVGAMVVAGEEIGRVGSSCAGVGRPSLTYRLMRADNLDSTAVTLEARFGSYTHLSPGEPQAVDYGAPETGDVVRAK